MSNKFIDNGNGTYGQEVPFDPVALANSITQAIANAGLIQTNADTEIASAVLSIAALLVTLNTAIAAIPAIATQVNPIIEAVNAQYPQIAALVTAAQSQNQSV